MKTTLLLLLCLTVSHAWAESDDAVVPEEEDLSEVSTQEAEATGPAAPQETRQRKTEKSHRVRAVRLPDPQQIKRWVDESGLQPDGAKWDTLERDTLYRRARSLSSDDLSKQYPSLDKAKLIRFQEMSRGK